MCILHLSVPLGTAEGEYPAACQPRAVIFMCRIFYVKGYLKNICMRWLRIVLQTCLCLLASPKKPQLCLLPHVCWMPLAHQECGLTVLPGP